MERAVVWGLALGWFVAGAATAREEVVVDAPITSIGLFKNGVAVVKRDVTLPPGPGRDYVIRDVVEPIHGTFFIESDATVDVRVTQRDVEVAAEFGVDPQVWSLLMSYRRSLRAPRGQTSSSS